MHSHEFKTSLHRVVIPLLLNSRHIDLESLKRKNTFIEYWPTYIGLSHSGYLDKKRGYSVFCEKIDRIVWPIQVDWLLELDQGTIHPATKLFGIVLVHDTSSSIRFSFYWRPNEVPSIKFTRKLYWDPITKILQPCLVSNHFGIPTTVSPWRKKLSLWLYALDCDDIKHRQRRSPNKHRGQLSHSNILFEKTTMVRVHGAWHKERSGWRLCDGLSSPSTVSALLARPNALSFVLSARLQSQLVTFHIRKVDDNSSLICV